MNKSINDIAVVGAGIIGINCAITLAKRGYNVTLIDKGAPGEGCSKGNAGHFATEQVFPLAEFSVLWQLPKMLLSPLGPVAISPRYFPKAIPWFLRFINNMFSNKRHKNTHALRQLNEKALPAYRRLLAESEGQHLLVDKGSLLVFEQTPLSTIKKTQKMYAEQGVPVELLDKDAVHKLEPNLQNSVKYALYFTDVAHTISPLSLSKHLVQYAANKGVSIIQAEVLAITHHEQGANIVTQNDTLNFSQIVLATGAWSKPFANALGYTLPIEGERGYSLDLPASTINQLNRPVASAERKFIMTPMSHGLRLGGTVEFAGLNQAANLRRANMLHTHASCLINELPDQQHISDQGWLGFRPSLPDSLPVIGRAPNHKNILFALGHQHLGLTQGAITGEIVGQIVDNEATDIDIAPFSIARFN